MYSRKVEGDNVAKAYSNNLRISVKNAKPVCKSVRGLGLPVAKQFLEDVLKSKKNIGGRYYPKKTREILNISAEKNAEFKNLDTKNMYILHIAPLEGTHMHRRRHKRNIGSRIKAAHLEVILKERTGKKAVVPKTKVETEVKKGVKLNIKENKVDTKTEEKIDTKTEEKIEVKKVETKDKDELETKVVEKSKTEKKKSEIKPETKE